MHSVLLPPPILDFSPQKSVTLRTTIWQTTSDAKRPIGFPGRLFKKSTCRGFFLEDKGNSNYSLGRFVKTIILYLEHSALRHAAGKFQNDKEQRRLLTKTEEYFQNLVISPLLRVISPC